jgi:hypothetical protein
MTPHWGRVLPFALIRADQFRRSRRLLGTTEWSGQIDTLIRTSGALTDMQKAAAEFWAEWGSSPAPHLIELAKFVSTETICGSMRTSNCSLSAARFLMPR